MSLNKLSLDVEKGVALGLKVGCAELKVNEVSFSGVDGSAGDTITTDGAGTLTIGPSLSSASYGWIGYDDIAYAGPSIQAYPTWVIPTVAPTVSGFDPAYYSADPNGLTVVSAGKYEITASIWISQAVADAREMLTILVDGVYTIPNAAETKPESTGGVVVGFQVSETLELAAGQQVSIGMSRGAGPSASTVSWWKLSAKKL